jgi:hypothetical protein
MGEPMFRHRLFFWMPKPYVPAMLLNLGFYGSTSLTDVHLAALTGDTVNAWSLQPRSSLTGRRKLEMFLGGKPTRLMLYLTSILLRRHYVVWTYGRKATEVGLSIGLEVHTLELRARCISRRLYPFSLKEVLRNSNSPWRLSLSHRGLCLCTKVAKTACLLEGWRCDPGFR